MKKINTIIIMAVLLSLFSCGSKDEPNIVPDVSEEESATSPFTSKGLLSLESEVSNLLNLTFVCGNITFDECHDAAVLIRKLYVNTFKNTYIKTITVDQYNSNNLSDKEDAYLMYDNSLLTLENLFKAHQQTWDQASTVTITTIAQIEDRFFDLTGVNLNCYNMSSQACRKISAKLLKVYGENNFENRVSFILVRATAKVNLTDRTLRVRPNTPINKIRNLFVKNDPTPTPSLNKLERLKRSIKRKTGIIFFCDPGVSKQACRSFGQQALDIINSNEFFFGDSPILKIQVVKSAPFHSTREIVRVKFTEGQRALYKIIKAHMKRYKP